MTSRASAELPSRFLRRRFWMRLLLFFGGIFLGVVMLFAGLQRSLIYAATPGPVPLSSSPLPQERLQAVEVTADDGIVLHGWLSTAADLQQLAGRQLVILFPGNAGNRSFRSAILADFNRCGCDCLICDYRGYADNKGHPTEALLAADAKSIWNFAKEQLGYASDRIVLCGESLGGGVATRLAWDLCRAGTPPAGLILRTTFTSLTDTAKWLYPWLPVRTFLVDRYPSAERLPEVTCPILVIHGQRDTVVPFSQGERLFQAASATSSSGIPKTFLRLPNSGHNDLQQTAAQELHAEHQRFLRSIFVDAPVVLPQGTASR